MAKSIEHAFYCSRAWELCREAYLHKVNHLCERCKAKGIYEPAKIVHHKIYLSEENYKNPEVSLNFANLEALCQDCHNKEHHDTKNERRFRITEDGQLEF